MKCDKRSPSLFRSPPNFPSRTITAAGQIARNFNSRQSRPAFIPKNHLTCVSGKFYNIIWRKVKCDEPFPFNPSSCWNLF